MLKLLPEQIQLHNVRVGQSQTMYVQLINTGDEDISITEIRPSCGVCTVAHVDGKTVIPAKSQVQMTVTYTPGSTSQVRVTKSVKINGSKIFTFFALRVN